MGRQIPGACWPAALVEQTSSRLSERLSGEVRWKMIKEDTRNKPLPHHTHGGTYELVHLPVPQI